MKANGGMLAVFVVALLVAGVIFIAPMSTTFMGATVPGFTTLSLSQAQFTSQNEFFSGDVWALTVAQGGLAQHAQGTFTNDQIGSLSGETPVNDFTIDITYSEQSCEYPIEVTWGADQISTYDYHQWSCYGWIDQAGASQVCQSFPAKYGVFGGFGVFTCWCVDENRQTSAISYGNIENPSVTTTSIIEVRSGNSVSSRTFSTSDVISGYIGSNVYVQWNGYLGTGTPCESQSPYYGFYDGSWKIGDAYRYSNYLGLRNNLLNPPNPFSNPTTLQELVNSVNNNAYNALSTSGFGNVYDATSLEGASIKKDLSIFTEVPVWTFYVDADWLGIVQPVADVQILDARSSPFKTSAEGQIYTLIQNTGDGPGGFNVWATCVSPFEFVGNTQSSSISPGQTKSFYLPISANIGQSVSGNCVVHASTLGASGVIERTYSVSVRADPFCICEPGTQRCDADVIEICDESCSKYNMVIDCGLSGKVCRYGAFEPECVEEGGYIPPPPEECSSWDFICHIVNALSGIGTAIWNWLAVLGIGVIIAIGAFVFIMFMTRK